MRPIDIEVPHLLIMIGIPGSGKSYFAERFSKTFKAPLISYENIFKHMVSLNADKKLLTETINQIMNDCLAETAKTKRTIIFDGQNNSRIGYDNLSRLAKGLGYEPMFVWVQTDIETAKKRSLKTNKNDPNFEVEFEKAVKQFSPIDRNRKNFIVISGKHTYSNQLKIVLKYLSQKKK